MTTGVMRFDGHEYTVTADGWTGGPEADFFNRVYPPECPPSGGHPVCRAFAQAVKELGGRGAEVVREPEPEPSKPGTVH